MVPLGISEFTFGYAFLHEQTNKQWGNLKAAPILPSLQQEADVGWDAHLPTVGTDFYYQFKLTERLSRANAKFIADGTYPGPYYRISLHRRDANRQHKRLRLHAQSHPDTYYVAPEMETLDDFNSAFLSKTVEQRSRLIRIAECKDWDDDEQHSITFQEGDVGWAEHSQTVRHGQSYRGTETENLYRESAHRWRPFDVAFARTLFEQTREFAWSREQEEEPVGVDTRQRALLDAKVDNTRRALLERTADIVAAYLGATLVIAGEAKPKKSK